MRPALGRSLLTSRALASDWIPAAAAVPRSAFLPEVIWPHDMASGRSVRVSRREDPVAWRRYAYDDVPVITQWDDGAGDGDSAGLLPSSSASAPSVVFAMLRDLAVAETSRVLEIGTGTGWNAALLGYRLGVENVTTVEVDQAVADAARDSLERFGLSLHVVTGDGLVGFADGAPYDRIIVTCGMRSVPFAWVVQARPGALILLPWGTSYSHLDATVRLTVAEDGRSAVGPFLGPVEFMKLRAQRVDWPEHAQYVPDDGVDGADRSSTTITESGFGVGQFDAAAFAIGLQVRDCVRAVAEKRNGARPVWFYSLTDRSWAVVMFRDQSPQATVHQAGPRRLWDEVEAAWHWWDISDRPEFERFGLTVTAEGQTAWLDTPDHPVPLVGG